MKKLLLAGCVLLALGCKRSASVPAETKAQGVLAASAAAPPATVPPATAAPATGAPAMAAPVPAAGPGRSEWIPGVKGRPIDLSLGSGTLSFCDDRGPRQVSLATGEETGGSQRCPKEKDDDAGFRCDDRVEVVGGPGGGNDVINFDGVNYPLKGLSGACAELDRSAIVSTGEEILLIDGAAGRSVLVSHEGGDRVAIGPGWVAWRTLEEKAALHVRATGSLPALKEGKR